MIDEYLRKTMEDNFKLFDKYPHYIFNFSGANRYRLMKEYYPADFAKVQQDVADGRWFPAGSSMEEGDVNAPSAEAIIRQVLYGNEWFQKRVRQEQRGVYAAGLLRISCVAADHPGARGRQGFFDTEADLGIFGECRRPGVTREHSGGNAVQCGCLGWAGWRKCCRSAESRRLQRSTSRPISARHYLRCLQILRSRTSRKNSPRSSSGCRAPTSNHPS